MIQIGVLFYFQNHVLDGIHETSKGVFTMFSFIIVLLASCAEVFQGFNTISSCLHYADVIDKLALSEDFTSYTNSEHFNINNTKKAKAEGINTI